MVLRAAPTGLLRGLKLRARALLTPRRVERELDDELSFHIERETRKLIATGMTKVDSGHPRCSPRFHADASPGIVRGQPS